MVLVGGGRIETPLSTRNNLLENLAQLAAAEHAKADYGFLNGAVNSTPLTSKEQQQYTHLLGFACTLQLENPVYETIYDHLLHLHVLNHR